MLLKLIMSMRLKMFIWHNPTTEQPEKVYEFPWSEAHTHELALYGRSMFSRQPCQRPIIQIPEGYLTEIKNQRHTVTFDELKKIQSQGEPEI